MKWPLVTRARYELLEQQFDRVLRERDAALESKDRALDQLINRVGFEPVSPVVRTELKEQQKEIESYLNDNQFDDPGSGMIDESILALANERGTKPS